MQNQEFDLTCIELFEICTHKIDRVYVHTAHRFICS